MRFDFEVGAESVQHFLVLPVHLHVVYLAVYSESVKQGLQSHPIEEERISAETELVGAYSIH